MCLPVSVCVRPELSASFGNSSHSATYGRNDACIHTHMNMHTNTPLYLIYSWRINVFAGLACDALPEVVSVSVVVNV